MDILKKQRVIVKQFPPQLPLRTDLRHPGLIPLVDLYATTEYTCVMKRWVDTSLASYVKLNQNNAYLDLINILVLNLDKRIACNKENK